MWTDEQKRMLDFLEKYGKSRKKNILRWDFQNDYLSDEFNISRDDFSTEGWGRYQLNIPTIIQDFLYEIFKTQVEPKISESAEGISERIDGDESSTELSLILNFSDRTITSYLSTNYLTEGEREEDIFEIPENVLNTLEELVGDTNITKLQVSYTGGGDSGYIEDSIFSYGFSDFVPEDVQDFVYGILPMGWEVNEGSQGNVVFNLEDKTATLTYTENYYEDVSDTIMELDF